MVLFEKRIDDWIQLEGVDSHGITRRFIEESANTWQDGFELGIWVDQLLRGYGPQVDPAQCTSVTVRKKKRALNTRRSSGMTWKVASSGKGSSASFWPPGFSEQYSLFEFRKWLKNE